MPRKGKLRNPDTDVVTRLLTVTARFSVAILMFLSLTACPASQVAENGLKILVLKRDKTIPFPIVQLCTTKKCCHTIDTAGHTQLDLDEDDKLGSKLSFTVVAPEGLEVDSVDPPQIPPDRSVRVVLRQRQKRIPGPSHEGSQDIFFKDAIARFEQGISLFYQGKYEEAQDPLTIAANLDPNEPRFANLLGLCLIKMKRFETAKLTLEAAHKVSIARDKSARPSATTTIIEANLKELEKLMSESPQQTP